MGVLDFIFGNKEDDLEATQEPEYTHPLESVPYFQRPMGSSTNDIQVREDDAGNPVFKGRFGEYTVRVNPDQRTIRQKAQDAVPAVKEAVTDYVQDPYLPSKESVKDFAYDATVGAVEDLGDVMFKGQGTLGDILGVAAGVGIAPKAINTLVDIAPEGDASAMSGMFLPTSKLKDGLSITQQANEMKRRGNTRDEIWEQLGVWQLGDSDEWLSEIDDSKAEIALTIKDTPPQMKTVTKTVRRQKGGTGLSQEEVIKVKTQARMDAINLRRQLETNLVTPQYVEDELARIQAELKAKTGSAEIPEYEEIEITKEVPIPKPKLTKGTPSDSKRKGSPLDQVLFHNEFYDSVRGANVTNMDDLPTAEAGRRQDSSAGEYNVSGVAYPDTRYNRLYTKNRGKSLISSFTNAGNWVSSGRNFRDEEIIAQMKAGKITEQQARAQMILSTMLHEVQHWSDSIFDSKSGKGFAPSRAPEIRQRAEKEFDRRFNNVLTGIKPNEDTSNLLSHILTNKKSWDSALKKVKQLDQFKDRPKFRPSFEEVASFGDKAIKYDGPLKNREKRKLTDLFARFYAARLTDAQLTAGEKLNNREDLKAIIATDFLDPKNAPLESEAAAELIVQILESQRGQDIYAPYMQLVQGRTAELRNLSNKEIYMLEMGESKARLVQARRDMTAEERKNTPPWIMLDREEWKMWKEGQY